MRKLILASLTISSSVAAQTPAARPRTAPLKGSLEQRLAQLIDVPPFNRATWGIYVVDDRGRVLYQRNADRFSVPASNTKLVVTAAAAVLLPADYRVTTSLYVNGRVDAGVLQGDLILYGRGDPTWSVRCYAVDTLAPGVCDSTFTAIDAIADSVRAQGIRRITGKLVGDGSYFEPTMIHYAWNAWDLTWWYAAPVSGLGFHDNSVDFRIDPGAGVDALPVIAWSPDLGMITFENRARTVASESTSTIGDNFFRTGGGWGIRAEGTVALGRKTRVESVALPDPNLYAARALAASLARRGVAVEGGAVGTTDSLAYRTVRCCASPLVDFRGRPLRGGLAPRGDAGLAAQALGGHPAGGPGDRQDGEHRPGQQPVRLHRAREGGGRGRGGPDHHVQRPGEWARRTISADAQPDRFGCGADRAEIALVFRLPEECHVRGMPRLDFGGGIDEVDCMVHGDRGLRGAGGDQLELAGVGRDVARREHTGDVRLHGLGYLDLALLDVQAPLGNRPERGDEAQLRNHAVDGDAVLFLSFVVEDGHGLDRVAAVDRLQLPEGAELHFPRRAQLVHLAHRRRVSPETVAPMDHQDEPGDPLEVHRPIESRIPAAHQ